MKIDPKKRLTASQVLNHPFFYDVSDDPFQVEEIYDAKIKSLLNKYPWF